MMKKNKMRLGIMAGAALAFMSSTVLANVMVYDVKVNGAEISYRVLDAADSVIELEVYGPLPATTVVGTETLPNAEGLNVFEFDGTAGGNPTVSGEQYGFRINASKAAGYGAFTSILDPSTNPAYHFFSPRGLAVNNNMDSDLFGLIYVSHPNTVATTGNTRTTSRGVYAFYPDASDPIGYRDTAANGSVTWAVSTASPYKIHFGQDGNLWIPDWSDAHSGLWRAPEDLSGTFPRVFDNTGQIGSGLVAGIHGSIAGVFVEFDGTDTIVTWQDEDLTTSSATSDGLRNIYTQTFTPSTIFPVNNPSTLLIDENNFSSHPNYQPTGTDGGLGLLVNDSGGSIERDNNGNWWVQNYRATGDNWPCLLQFDATGANLLWDSRTGGTGAVLPENDPFAGNSAGFCYDENANTLYVASLGGFRALNLDSPLPTSNIPAAVTAVQVLAAPGTISAGAIEHDPAGNVYFVAAVPERLYMYSPPGPNSFTFERASLTLAGGAPLSAEKNWVEYK